MVAVKEGEGYDPLESYSAEMDAPRRRRYMAIGEPGGVATLLDVACREQ